MRLRLGQLENICTFCICCHMTSSALSSSFVKCVKEPAACTRLSRLLCAKIDVCLFLRREPLLQFWFNNPIWRICLSAAGCSLAPHPHDEPDLHALQKKT